MARLARHERSSETPEQQGATKNASIIPIWLAVGLLLLDGLKFQEESFKKTESPEPTKSRQTFLPGCCLLVVVGCPQTTQRPPEGTEIDEFICKFVMNSGDELMFVTMPVLS